MPGFSCPPPGLFVNYGTFAVTHRGADPSDPAVCLAETGTGVERRLANFWQLPSPAERELRRGMAPLFPLAVGKSTRFTFAGGAWNDQRTFLYEERWRVLGIDTMPVGGGLRTVFVVERVQEGQAGNTALVRYRYLVDQDTGVFLRGAHTVERGSSSFRPYAAIGFSPPR